MTAASIRQLNQRQQQRFANVVRSLKIEWDGSERDIEFYARKLVSGNIPTRTFELYGHPLGRGNAASVSKVTKSGTKRRFRVTKEGSMVPLLPINAQSGKLRASLRVFKRESKGVKHRRLYFVDPKAKWTLRPGGTKTTVDRGFWVELGKYQRARKKEVIKTARKGYRR